MPRKFGGFYLVLFDLKIRRNQNMAIVLPVTYQSYGVDIVVKNFSSVEPESILIKKLES